MIMHLTRIKELSEKEGDVDKKMALRKLLRSLQGVSIPSTLGVRHPPPIVDSSSMGEG